MKITEGYMPFKGHQTYYRIVGEKKENNKKPLILLHGGPGSTHNYFEVLDTLADLDDRQIIMYDQIGCGNSYVEDTSLFNAETWLEELKALREHLNLDQVHILGQSWGGMQLLLYVCNENPQGVKSIILSSTLPSSKMWEIEQARMIKELPIQMQDDIKVAVETDNYDLEGYHKANDEFMKRHAFDYSQSDIPECLTRKKKSGTLAYIEAWGPNEFTPLGNLKDYDVTDKLEKIKIPTLITSGGNDLSTPYINKYMNDKIANSQWQLFRTAAHMPFVDDNQEYIDLLIDWLNKND